MNPSEEWQLDTRHIGQRVQVFQSLASTNSHAALLADDASNHGRVVLASEQTAGRGQQCRAWHAPADKAVLMSVVLFPPPPLRRPALLTAWAAVSVCETIRQAIELEARIKWPNDVLIRGRKVCGILIESKVQASRTGPLKNSGTLESLALSPNESADLAVVVGIGLNVNQTAEDFRQADLPHAGSLALFTQRPLDCPTIARLLVDHLDEEYDLLARGDLNPLVTSWNAYIGLLGKLVAIESSDGRHWGRLRELTLDGLDLDQGRGQSLNLAPEAIRHLEPA
jgi:BirA family transcriptional regulator, biotin operon repressor / biotin---[acetyl-CoA-carboxylase] ligase